MIQPTDLIAIKQRVLIVADVADLILNAPDKVRFDEETYRVVAHALANNKSDITALLAELDLLRAGVGASLFPEGSVTDASHGDANDRGTVEPLPSPAGGGSGDQVGADDAGVGGPVQAGGVDGERSERPKPRRHRKSNKRVPERVDAGSPAEPVGGGEG